MKADLKKLTDSEMSGILRDLPGWLIKDGKLFVRYRFGSFSEAWAFMTYCALAAEKANHHPDLKNFYNIVEILLWTHDVEAITEKDSNLAKELSSFASKFRLIG